MTDLDIEKFMTAALMEGRKALPKCLPNPPVGCVIVKNNEIIARGHTNEPGQPHAEAMALNNLPNDTDSFIMFVTLEPCSFFGRTPSCARTIVKTNCTEVYVGMIDPHIKNQGRGIAILEEAGIKVRVGVLQEEVKKDLEPFLIKST